VAGEGRAAGHRHALALAAGQGFHRLLHRADADLEVLHVADRFGQHLFLVDDAEAFAHEAGLEDLAAEEQVFGDCHRRRDGQVLINRFDAVTARVDRRAKVDRLTVEQQFAGVRHDGAGQGFDQAGFAGAVVADHGQDFTGAQFEIGAVEGCDVAVALGQAARLEHRGCIRERHD
jgi:hypothetical protein